MALVYTWMTVTLLLIHKITGDPSSSMHDLFEEYFQWRLKDDPELATYLNIHDYDGLVGRTGLGEMNYMKRKADEFLGKLSRIDYSALPRKDKYNMDVFNYTLTDIVDGYQWRLYGALNPISFLAGIQIDPESLLKITRFESKLDFENFISRIGAYPDSIKADIALMSEAVQLGRTHNRYSMLKVPGQLAKMIKTDPTEFVYYKPFVSDLNKLNIPESDKSDLRERAKKACRNIIDTLKILKEFIETVYMVHTRGSFGVGGLNRGAIYYVNCLKWHLTSDLDPGLVHQIGLREVERISQKMKHIMQKQNFTGTISEYFAMLRKDPRFHFKTADEIISRYQDILDNRLYPALPRMFRNVPQLKVKVTKMANDGPPAQYMPGSSDGSREAEFQANVFRPSETDSFIMVGDALHEGVPGHHLQFIYKQTADLPKFRKEDTSGSFYAVPFSYPGYSSYVEGWALYAESLGEELGLYRDDYELMGRYSNEIFRACRLVVDTGLHFMGWSRYRALSYMQKYNSLSGGNLENEIDRYITWPGQACAYKIGELKIRELRNKAEQTLGSKFDIRDFHEVVLRNGAVSLKLLERIIDNWIGDVQSGSPAHVHPGGQQHHSPSAVPATPGVFRTTPKQHHSTRAPVVQTTHKQSNQYTGLLPIIPNIG